MSEANGNGTATKAKTIRTNVKKAKPKHMKRDEYRGNPMVVFMADQDDRWPFSFGAGKAARILAAIDELGADKVIAELREIAASNSGRD